MSPDEFEDWQIEHEKWLIWADGKLKALAMNILGASPREADELVAMTNNGQFEAEVLGKHGSIEGWLGARRDGGV